jgi:hypothetical protein
LNERADDCGALLHAARELERITLRELTQANHGQEINRTLPVAGRRQLAKFDRQQHVVEHGAPRQQHWRLEHHGGLLRWPAQWLAIQLDRSGGVGQQPGQHLEQSRLSAAALPDNRNEFAVIDIEVEALKGRHFARAGDVGL